MPATPDESRDKSNDPGITHVKNPTHMLVILIDKNDVQFQAVSYDLGQAQYRTFEADIHDSLEEPVNYDSAFAEFWAWLRDYFDNFDTSPNSATQHEPQERYETGEAMIRTLQTQTQHIRASVDDFDNDDVARAPEGVTTYIEIRSALSALNAIINWYIRT